MQADLIPKIRDNQVVVVDFKGWDKYQDLCILSRESLAKIALGRLIDYCVYDFRKSVAQFEKIADLNEFNPHGLKDMSDAILGLGVDLYLTCYENNLFEVGTLRDLPYELTHVGPRRLYLRRLVY